MQDHWPITRTIASALAAFAAVAVLHFRDASTLPLGIALSWVLVGAVYTQLFEHAWHRLAMHQRFRLLVAVRKSHLHHHRALSGPNFRTRNATKMSHIVGRWWSFPVLLAAHYMVLAMILPAGPLVAFLLGTLLHYSLFEITHWMTHVEDHAFDRLLARIPFVSSFRRDQIEHHRAHHETPSLAFNFNPPYIGDRLAATMPADVAAGGLEETSALVTSANGPARDLPANGFRMPWLRPVARYGSVALVVGVAVIGGVVLVKNYWSPGSADAPSEQNV